eukprot:TRINITY_DN62798_c0_g1_i1.p1 TRINITY_DN62798_c0_g1~~TRINITY_DN62798_c0_g1_i1.p1  ORF type:complete len:522 (-),score=106.78 TRINITY_DN62798_c0_g1_i1:75-1640(-)
MARSSRGTGSSGNAGVCNAPLNWRLVLVLFSALLIMIWTCSQLLILGNDCHAERERALHAEDLVLNFQSQREQDRKIFRKQIEDLQKQLQQAEAERSVKTLSGRSDANLQQQLVAALREEVRQLQLENSALKGVAVPHPQPLADQAIGSSAVLPAASGVVSMQGSLNEDTLRSMAANGAIGVAVIVCKRPKYLARTMDAILRSVRDPSKFPLVISQDGDDQAMREMVQKSYVQTGQAFHMFHQHDPNAKSIAAKFGGSKQTLGYVYIAQHFGFAMKRMFDDFGFGAVIFLEEDLEVSLDFFSYFGTMRPLLHEDKDLFCVSAWNDNGYDSLVSDPKLAYRTDFFPGLGWMMDKSMWDELRDRWTSAYWDEFMRRPDVRKGRKCIRPEISRSYTFGEEGTSAGQFFKGHLARIKLNDVMVDWSTLDILRLSSTTAFEEDLTAQIRAARPVGIDEVDNYAGQFKSFRVEYEDSKYKQVVAKKFGLMPDEKEKIRRMSYRGVIPFVWQTNRIYLHTSNWPHDLP